MVRFDGDLVMDAIGPDLADVFGDFKGVLHSINHSIVFLSMIFKKQQSYDDVIEKSSKFVTSNMIVRETDVYISKDIPFTSSDGYITS